MGHANLTRATGTNMEDYFPLGDGYRAHFIEDGAPDASPKDDFAWEIFPLMVDLGQGGGEMAAQMEIIADEVTDALHRDRWFWRFNQAGEFGNMPGDLESWGIHNFIADPPLPDGDIILDDPMVIGRRDMCVPTEIQDTATLTIDIVGNPVTLTIMSTADYLEFIPVVDTAMGPFTNVLQMVLSIQAIICIDSNPFNSDPCDLLNATVDVIGGEFLFTLFGMIAHDQDADTNDAESQFVDEILIAGNPILVPVIVQYEPTLEMGQVVARGPIPSGNGTIEVATENNTLTYDITVNNLTSAETTAEIRGFAFSGNNGTEILHTLPAGSPKTGTWNFAEDQQDGILMGQTYIDIKTANNPNGELRGQINEGSVPVVETRSGHWFHYD
jgi:hypothetical protein